MYVVGKCLEIYFIDGVCVDFKYGVMLIWNILGVFDMFEVFSGVRDFNGNIENWNVVLVMSMFCMFYGVC